MRLSAHGYQLAAPWNWCVQKPKPMLSAASTVSGPTTGNVIVSVSYARGRIEAIAHREVPMFLVQPSHSGWTYRSPRPNCESSALRPDPLAVASDAATLVLPNVSDI